MGLEFVARPTANRVYIVSDDPHAPNHQPAPDEKALPDFDCLADYCIH